MNLYQAILNRRSIRRYDKTPLDKETLAQVDHITDQARPLVEDNRCRVMRRDVVDGEDLTVAIGGYGHVVSPPHYLVPYIVGDTRPLVDLGYRMEQMAVRLARIGIGSCFIGTLERESNLRVRFRLPREAHTAAILLFGRPVQNLGGRAVNAVIRRATGGANRLPLEEIFFDTDFDHPAKPPAKLKKIVQAARQAPSALNTQPWRILWRDGALYLYVRRDHPNYEKEDPRYRYVDGGNCMANITLALEAVNLAGDWERYAPTLRFPKPPASLEPLAKLMLNG